MAPQLPPSPRSSSSNRELLREPHNYFLALTRQYGDVVCYRPAPEPAYLVNHPDYVGHVLVENSRNYSKATYINQMFKKFTDGLLTAEGEQWSRLRRLMQPSFNKPRLVKLDEVVISQAAHMVERWQQAADQGQAVYVTQEISRLTLSITTRAVFGVDLGEEISQVGKEVDASGALLERPNNPRFRDSLHHVEGIVQRIITQRRQAMAGAEEADDLLGSMMSVRDGETGAGMDDIELRNQVLTLLLAGYETTASALTWTFYLLSQNPEAVNCLRHELQDVLGSRTPTYADLPNLDYTRMVFEEALRLFSPAWVLGRVALEDDLLGDFLVPAGTIIAISPYTLHRNPAYWEDPERFDPERFTQARSAGRHRFAYIPFGAGPRKCIGNNFAMIEAQLIIAMVMQRFDLAPAPDSEKKPEVVFVLRPNRQMKLIVSRSPGYTASR